MSAIHPQPPVRPLPARPSLEFERKEAKALLRRLRAGDPESLAHARARLPEIDGASPDRIQLADAQLVLAREYGFASWPKMVHWFAEVERQRHGWKREMHDRESANGWMRTILAEHRDRRAWTALMLSAYVPRLYGMRAEEVFACEVTEDEARLAVAREGGFPSWEVLLENVDDEARRRSVESEEIRPMRFAAMAIEAGDLDELRRVVGRHPELLHPPQHWADRGGTLLRSAFHHERRKGIDAMRPIVSWLESQGLDVQLELNRQLCGHRNITTEKVRWLLDRGADPSWVAPTGIPVLEHALIRYTNPEAVELVAARTAPRPALWIAAGLGDVEGVGRFLDRNGKPTPAARQNRPRFDLVGPFGIPSHPEPDDEALLIEAFLVAILNGRTAVLEYMVARGFPINTLRWGMPLLIASFDTGRASVVECLIRCGADLDLRGWRPQQSAREIARSMFVGSPEHDQHRRIVELCGMDPDAILAERDARPVGPPRMHPMLERALELAGNDAFALGQPDIRPENLLFGVLRSGGIQLLPLVGVGRADLERFGVEVGVRLRTIDEHVERPELPMNAHARAVIDAMLAIAVERRREDLGVYNLLHALVRTDRGPAAELLARYGANVAAVRAHLESGL